jgi:Bacterial Ig domain
VKRAAWLLLLAGAAAQAASFSIVNTDGAGEGLNDATPFTPIGGNNATTLGQARLNVLQEAGRIWGAQLSSSVPIVVQASFDPLTCATSTGTLGSAGAHYYFNAGGSGFLVPAALADAITGTNNNARDDIFAQFNSDVRSGNSACLNGTGFYLGLDHASGQGIDLLAVTLHEFGHGLGFVSLVSQDGTGVGTNGTQLSAFDQFVYSETLGRFWSAMSNAERATSLTDNGKLVFNSPSVNGALPQLTCSGSNPCLSNPGAHLRLYAPTTYNDGSSGSHWDTPAQWTVAGFTRSLLMEPFITANPQGVTDFTGCVLKDLGWLGTRCPDSTGVPPGAGLAAQSQSVTTSEDVSVGITILGTGGNSGPLTYALTALPAKGTLSTPASMTSSSGVSYTYTPAANANGADTFAFTVSDGTNTSAVATVTINITPVNDAPVANPQTVNTLMGAAVAITLSGSDVEGSSLTYAVVGNPSSGMLSGTAPTLTYTPNSGFSGTDSFTFRVNDGALNSANATVSVIVTAPPSANSGGSSGGGGGGGGAMTGPGLLWLLLTLLGLLVSRRVPTRCMASGIARFWGGSAS